jgi:predicted enzyme related to lactoylglutathione lyase
MDAPMGEGMRWVTVAPAGSTTECTLVSAFPEGGPALGTNTGIVLETDDIDAAYRDLSGRGVRFVKEPSREPWGGWAELVDQDGNTFGLHSNQFAE